MKKIKIKMKKITFENKTYLYKTINYYITPFDPYSYKVTYFYDGVETVYKNRWSWKKWQFEKYEKIVPKFVFSIDADSEDPLLSKEFWRHCISEKIKTLNRKNELIEGKLI